MMHGSCLCGDVKYILNIDKPISVANCHCATCQKQSGAPFVTVMFVPSSSLIVEGRYSTFLTKADSGNTMTRSFCPSCGTSLFGQSSVTDKIRPIMVASLDEPKNIKPEMNFWLSSANPHTIVDKELLSFEGQFTRFPDKEG